MDVLILHQYFIQMFIDYVWLMGIRWPSPKSLKPFIL